MKAVDIVICGAGIAGISIAYDLAVIRGLKDIVIIDERPPMSLTSDKSTECYRNWWPGPGDDMVSMMNRSIDLLETRAEETGNAFHLNRRGYFYITADNEKANDLRAFAQEASGLGAGALRIHDGKSSGEVYIPASPEGYVDMPIGADLILDSKLIRQHAAYLSEDTKAVLHVRRAGWLSAQQYGIYLLDQIREHGVELLSDRVVSIDLKGGKVNSVELANGSKLNTPVFVNAAGPMVSEVGKMLGIDIPVFCELHMKASIDDTKNAVGRQAPLVISIDEQVLPWSSEEIAMLQEDDETRWLTQPLPSGSHTRPEGGLNAQTILMQWYYHFDQVEPTFPPDFDPMYPEIALRGLCNMIPGLRVYLDKLPKPYIDGGYYTKTQENRPLACPLSVGGAYMIGALSGFGIMASAGMADLLADHITQSQLPHYAPAFDLTRYDRPEYQQLLKSWGASGQI